jgi:hypothetical protein
MKIFLLVICLFVVGCVEATGIPENRWLYDDYVARQMFVDALKARSIPYRVDAEGGVWYPAKDVKAVDEIAQEILKARFSGPGVSFEEAVDFASFKRKLTEAGIPYQTKFQHDREWITWGKEPTLRVKEIQEEVENENLERAKMERAKKVQQK